MLTGEVGSGKSTLIRQLVDSLDTMRFSVSYLCQADMKPRDFYESMLRHLGEEVPFGVTKAKRRFQERLAQVARDKELVVIIDEAQDVTPAMLLELRYILNSSMDARSLLSLILVGQPELRITLRKNRYDAIAQRVSLQYHLNGFNEEETSSYIRHQMEIAQRTTPLFATGAIRQIYASTRGIPRMINHICTLALFDAERTQTDIVEESQIGRILADMARQRGVQGIG
ncbi:ExeA family protein [Heliorestis convoluta]|uniref:ExeA family protein n=1 Tax=Heliorestis convoluta TaxID=356322 RepID=UPI001FAA6C6D|nr:AAA family ATPase [Heliorestis convoluta]